MMRSHACGLHSVLRNSWKCTCHVPHKAYLHLQHPAEASTLPPIFGVTFPDCRTTAGGSQATDHNCEADIWKYTSISVSKMRDATGSSVVMTGSSTTSLTSNDLSPCYTSWSSQTSQTTTNSSISLQVTTKKKARRVQFAQMLSTFKKQTSQKSGELRKLPWKHYSSKRNTSLEPLLVIRLTLIPQAPSVLVEPASRTQLTNGIPPVAEIGNTTTLY